MGLRIQDHCAHNFSKWAILLNLVSQPNFSHEMKQEQLFVGTDNESKYVKKLYRNL